MSGWEARKLQLPNHNFETVAIKFNDGRAGLCYHGSAIWNDQSGGWESFIADDWNTVWKDGKPCQFKDLPPDMRIACPVCGAKIHPDDMECGQCGIIFDKMKDAPEEPEQKEDHTEEKKETRRSRVVDFSLAGVVLIIAGVLLYNVFKPDPPQSAPARPTTAQEQAAGSDQGQPSGSDAYDYSQAEQDYSADYDESSDTGGEDLEPITVEKIDYYSHIDLDNTETAHQQLMEATQELNQEAQQVREALVAAATPEEKRQAALDKIRYEQKSVQLSQMIKAFNAMNADEQ
jgi:transcription initiation factor TFIIIB Brf1 subunit/transcription initiation factor TFIIB